MPDSFLYFGQGAERGLWDSPRVWHAIPGPVGFSAEGSLVRGGRKNSSVKGPTHTADASGWED